MDVEVFVAVEVDVAVDVAVDVVVDVDGRLGRRGGRGLRRVDEVDDWLWVGAAAEVVPVAIDDRDGLGRSIDREGVGRFEPPPQDDATTSRIAQPARETLTALIFRHREVRWNP